MAGIKISALTPVASLTGAEVVPLNQAGVTMSGTVSQFVATLGTPITLANGGTNHALTADNGGIVYSDATKLDILAHTTTANQVLLSGNAAAPTWSTATYPATTTINQILYSSSANTIAGLATGNDGVLVTGNTGIPSILAGPGASGKILQSNSALAPTWSTPTYPSASGSAGKILRSDGTNNVYTTSTFADTYAASTILYSNGANTVTGLATANSASLVTNSTGVPAWSGTMTNGQLIIGSTGATPTAGTLTAGTGITITNGAAAITVSTTGGGLTWVDTTGATQQIAVNTGYVSDDTSTLVTFTLPATGVIGDTFTIVGKGAGLWTIVENTGQGMLVGSQASSLTTGSVSSTDAGDCVTFVCTTTNTKWRASSVVGNLTVV